MNQTRTFLLVAWLLVGAMLYLQWTQAPAPVPPTGPDAQAGAEPLPGDGAVPAGDGSVPQATAVPAAPALSGTAPAASADPAEPARLLTVRTDVLDLRVDLRGGSVVGADLLAYPVDKDRPERKVRLLDLDAADFSVAQSGLVASAGAAPSHEAMFRTEDGRGRYELAEGQDRLEVPLVWTDPGGLGVRKVLVLERGSYAITVRQEIRNQGEAVWRGYGYQQLQRVAPPERGGGFSFTNPEAYSFVGAAWYSPEDKFEKRTFADFVEDGPLNKDVTGGWISMLQHHFALVWVPDKSEPQRFSLATLGNGQTRYLVRSVGAPFELAPGASATREATLWVGPKLQAQMQDVAEGLKLTLDYGVFTFLAQPMFDFVLKPLHALTGNWGWAIILTVLIIKLILYPLSAKQYQSFARMRAIQPRIEALKERYGDDRQKFQMAVMELYKKEKVNPAAGCLPILVTIPVFIALYWMLLESVEMRQAPWIGWIQNLTAPDPYFILPAINLAVMYLTQKMTPTPGMDPMQKKIMTFMPIAFGVLMAFFPSGLVLYWCTNGILGLLQQWVITKRHGDKTAPAAVK
ncbi:membrane protein insertase YidC [Arenimonas fontis]|uniref:Membrane protein insertase YidC n=1 Tax=Arenimonas fontis TaxID=2608255 RepID=A0A5B2ZA60_9GAMM|nr:membrane protein insertase YidC [Arenimonas fontis]KAA2284032.1 membrane protein insertase YidC [Arenimonas fontis]